MHESDSFARAGDILSVSFCFLQLLGEGSACSLGGGATLVQVWYNYCKNECGEGGGANGSVQKKMMTDEQQRPPQQQQPGRTQRNALKNSLYLQKRNHAMCMMGWAEVQVHKNNQVLLSAIPINQFPSSLCLINAILKKTCVFNVTEAKTSNCAFLLAFTEALKESAF